MRDFATHARHNWHGKPLIACWDLYLCGAVPKEWPIAPQELAALAGAESSAVRRLLLAVLQKSVLPQLVPQAWEPPLP